MRENRTYGLEGGETGLTGLPYPYQQVAVGEQALCCERISAATSQLRFSLGHFPIGRSGERRSQAVRQSPDWPFRDNTSHKFLCSSSAHLCELGVSALSMCCL